MAKFTFMPAQKLKKLSGVFFFLIGMTLLLLLFRKFGLENILLSFERMGWKILIILSMPTLWYLCHTFSWYSILEDTGNHLSFFQLFSIKMSGESVNTLTPVSFMGGDPLRIYLLKKKMPGSMSTASTVLDRTMHSVATILLVFCGLLLAWVFLDLPREWNIAFVVLLSIMVIAIATLIHHQSKGIFDRLTRLLARLGIKKFKSEAIQKKIQDLDERISLFYRINPRRFFIVLAFHFLGRLAGVLEIFLIATFLGIPLDFFGAFFMASLSILVNMTFVFIPGSLGVMEGSYGALFSVMGLDPATGVALQLIRRFRSLFWVFIGLIFMLIYSKLSRQK